MFIPDPDFYPSRISAPGSKNRYKTEGCKKIRCHTFFCSHKFQKILNYFIFALLKKKIWAKFQRIIELLPKKLSISSQKYEFWIRDQEKTIPDPESRGQKGTGSGSATLAGRSSAVTGRVGYLPERCVHPLNLYCQRLEDGRRVCN
jgi:hypothetical protein